MGLFDRISRVVRANLNDLVSKAEDPEKILEQTILEMQEDLVKLRQSVAQTMAAQNRLQQQYNQSQSEAVKWERNARIALERGEENLARQALERKKTFTETANALKIQLDNQSGQIEALKRNLNALESKIAEAKTKKDMLKARINAAKAQEQLQSTLGQVGNNNAMAAFERMEERVQLQEARAQAAAQLGTDDLETQFARLESSDVDEELAALKAQMSLPGTAQHQAQLPQGQEHPNTSKSEPDDDLERLKRQLDEL